MKPTVTRWYVIRVEQYLKALSGKRLANHSAKDVTDYLEAQSRNTKIKDWQFLQIVDAIQNLFTMLEVPCLNKVDWHLANSGGSYHPDSWLTDNTESPGTDAGNPVDEVIQEPAPNGAHISLGAYGGTTMTFFE